MMIKKCVSEIKAICMQFKMQIELNNLVLLFIVCNCVFVSCNAYAYDLIKEGNRLILTGEITKEDIQKIVIEVKQDSQLNELELRDSIGTRGYAGLAVDNIEDVFKNRQLKTFVRGKCASTCAFIFLIGETRTMLPTISKVPTHLMIHAFRYNITKEVDYGLVDRNFQRIMKKSNGKFPIKLLERIYDDAKGNGDGELYVFRDILTAKQKKVHVIICGDNKIRDFNKCEPILNITPEDLGITLVEKIFKNGDSTILKN